MEINYSQPKQLIKSMGFGERRVAKRGTSFRENAND
jgi:hypothetical protein